MRLDDIENADAPAVESYLSKIKVLRQIAHKLIDFLAQLEDFQKKLWLKKKFVTETNYCITLDRVPVELYPKICANQAQLEEWIQLFAIDEIQGDLSTPAFSNPLTVEFLQANQNLVLDTQFFDDSFKAELIASIEDFDEQSDGLLIHSENFQALNLLENRYRKQVKTTYIDPPYNTGSDGFIYKDNYQHSNWMSLIENRIRTSKSLLEPNGSLYASINEDELFNLKNILDIVFGIQNYMSNFVVKVRHENRILKGDKSFHEVFENVLAYRNSIYHEPTKRIEDNSSFDGYEWQVILNTEPTKIIALGDKEVEIYSPENYTINKIEKSEDALKRISVRGSLREGNSSGRFYVSHLEGLAEKYPGYVFKVPDMGADALGYRFFWTPTIESKRINGDYFQGVPLDRKDTKLVPYPNLWDFEKNFNQCANEGGITFRNGKKPIDFINHILMLSGVRYYKSANILDFFAGSGSTGHAVIDLNREDNGNRKYILAEMGNHFDTVLKPRLAKVAYASEWKNGKPESRDTGISHCFKYIRLESYEDTLNNLRLASDPVRQRAIDANSQLKQDYMLHYMLDVETRGSQSLLNIDAFADPTAYTLEVKKPGSDESVERTVDLIETFNYLIGLRVEHTAAPQGFNANFSRVQDAHAPQGQTTRLVLDGRLQQDDNGPWWLRKIEGWLPADPANPNNGARDKVLIVWRKLTGDLEQDNLVLDEWFKTHRINSRDFEYATIYVNGSNNLPNLKKEEDRWKVRLIEEEFMQRMWDVEG